MKNGEWRVENVSSFPKGDNPLGNRFYGYNVTDLTLPDGRPATYHGIDVGPCVHVVAVADDETTFLVRQSRPNARQRGSLVVPRTLELPGGFADVINEDGKVDLHASAAEELLQEVGLVANLQQIGRIYPSPGVSDEIDHIFLGTSAQIGDAITNPQEATEADMRIVTDNFGVLFRQMLRSEVPVAAQTIAAMAMAADHL
jgi:hypothetical protein